MLEQIIAIGEYVQSVDEKDLAALWQKDDKVIENLLVLNYDSESSAFEMDVRIGSKKMYRESLLFQKGNGHVGAGVKIENFKGDSKEIKKHEKKLASAMSFMEIPEDKLQACSDKVFNFLADKKDQSFYVMLNKDGKTALESQLPKFEELIEKTYLNKSHKKGICHMCGNEDHFYHTAVYNCYTNDKEIYSNTENESFVVCDACLKRILHGKLHVDKYHKTWWMGSEVMFLPHEYNADISDIYTSNNIGDQAEGEGVSFKLQAIKEHETEVIEDLGKSGSLTDIVFFDDPKTSSEWKIRYHIRDVLPSRFSHVGQLLRKYHYIKSGQPLKLGGLIPILVNGGYDSRESRRFLESILKGRKINRNEFFMKIVKDYKKQFYDPKSKHKVYMFKYHQAFNFLVEAGCLEGGWQLMDDSKRRVHEYRNAEDLFEQNPAFFDSNTKKAWFMLGEAFRSLNQLSAFYYTDDIKDEKVKASFVSPLERTMPYSNRFDQRLFIELCSKFRRKAEQYRMASKVNTKPNALKIHRYCVAQINEARNYMAQEPAMKIHSSEAEYVFLWGKDQWFKGKEKSNASDEEGTN